MPQEPIATPVAVRTDVAATRAPAVVAKPTRAPRPAPAAADVDLGGVEGLVRKAAATLPVTVRLKEQRPAARVKVELLPESQSRRLGEGVYLFRVSGTTDGAQLDLAADLKALGAPYGGGWADRASLSVVPECVLTGCSPADLKAAPPAPVKASRKADGTATAALPALADTGTTALAQAATTAAPSLLIAAAAAVSGPAGSYSASPLSPSATWSAGGQTGDFTWAYPLGGSPVPGGVVPTLGLNYSSGSVDGRVASTNNQPSWIGDGFSFDAGAIERRYVACSDDATTGANNTAHKTNDRCWKTDNASLTLSGHSGELVKASATTWRLRDDDGTRIERLTGATNGDNDGEYWRVTTTDGTQYYFGRNRGAVTTSATNSTWTVPVFGNNSGEPCYNATFASGFCQQAWRWNLDAVVDPHGNAMSYYYTPETNVYGRDNNTYAIKYTRSGVLARIDYGQHTSLPTAQPTARFVFTTSERCLPSGSITCAPAQLTSANASYWPDVPFDQICTAAEGKVQTTAPANAGCPNRTSPSFFTRLRLTGVSAEVYSGTGTTFTPVDSWAFTHQFLDPGDGTSKVLWLRTITRTGKVGTAIALPPVTLNPTGVMPNRVDAVGDGAPPMNHFRMSYVDNGLGGRTSVNYSAPDCTAASKPADVSTNTRRCFPVYWAADGQPTPTLNWFHKYVVDSVITDDQVGGGTDQITQYQYLDGAAWHYDSDVLTPAKERTWGQWRGYSRVRTMAGTAPNQSMTETRYFRGMHGDKALPSGTKTVAVTDWGGTVQDVQRLNGFQRESTVYNGPTGAVVTSTLNEPWLSAVTATDGTWNAQLLATASTTTRRPVGAGYQTSKVTTDFNVDGLPTQVDSAGDTTVVGDETCTRYTYNPSTTIRDTTSSEVTYGVSCASNPSGGANILSGSRNLYDGATDWATAPVPTKGDVTQTYTLADWPSGASAGTWLRTNTSTFDVHGRLLKSTDALNNMTETTYTPATGGPTTSSTVYDAKRYATTTTVATSRGLTTSMVDPNARRTDLTYDALGRITGVWMPNRSKAGGLSANRTFTYTLSSSAPSFVTTSDLRNSGAYSSSVTILDGQLRTRQVQSPAADGTANRVITDVVYDARGLETESSGPALATGVVSGTMAAVLDVEQPSKTTTTYDGANRVTRVDVRTGVGSANWTTASTITAYDGPNVHVTPPGGGTATKTFHDALGRVTMLRQYTGSNPTDDTQKLDTTYGYRPDGLLASMKDPAGNLWSRTYDLRGRLVSSVDPDTGTTTTTYNDNSQPVTVKDGRNVVVAYGYDVLGRKTAVRDGGTSGPIIASWAYDTVASGLGLLASSTRTDGTRTYTKAVTGYTALNQPTGSSLTVSGENALLDRTYTTSATYNVDGGLKTMALPSGITGIPNETLNYAYDAQGRARSLTGYGSYVAETVYSPYGSVAQRTYSQAVGKSVFLTQTYEQGTRRLLTRSLARENLTGLAASTTYRYDAIGNVASVFDAPTDAAAGTTADNQCFAYDKLRRLTAAWTPSAQTCTTPSAAGLGGTAPYMLEWTFDNATGNRLSEKSTTPAGAATTTTYQYPAATQPRPHAPTSTKVGTTTQAAITYDDAGNSLTRRASASATPLNLTWNSEGRVSGTTGQATTSYVYDADGTRMVRRDSTGTTLYLDGGTEVRLPVGGTAVEGTRHYSFDGETVATRTSTTNVRFVFGDLQGTGELAIDATTQTVTSRRSLPYGGARGTSAWLGQRGFVDGVRDGDTALTLLGARYYDPLVGGFISADPLIDLNDSRQWNAFSYSNANPTTFSDPDGLMLLVDGGGGGGGGSSSGSSSGTTTSKKSGSSAVPGSGSTSTARSYAHGGRVSHHRSVDTDWTTEATRVDFAATCSASAAAEPQETDEGFWGGLRDFGAGLVAGGADMVGLGDQFGDWAKDHGVNTDSGWYTAGRVTTAVASLALPGGAAFASVRLLGRAAQAGGMIAKAQEVASIARAAGESSSVIRNKAIGDAASDAILSRYAPGMARREVTLQATSGPRRIDVLTSAGHSIESKVGRTGLTSRTRQELARDVELRNEGKVASVTWEFSRSPITGRSGPSSRLRAALDNAGIGIVE